MLSALTNGRRDGAGARGFPPAWRSWRMALLLVLAVAVLAHVPELVGWVTCNPIYGDPGVLAAAPRHVLRGACTIDGNDGTTLQALGGRAAEMWLHGRLPWWNSLAGIGLPLAAEAQPAAFFLPFVLLLHFFSGIVVLKLLMQMLTGACALAFFRELGLGRTAAVAGSVCFELNGSFAWYAHSHATLPIAFLPALLFGLERCRTLAVAGRGGGEVWVGLALAYSIVAGFPETAFMDGLLAGIWALLAIARTPAARRFVLIRKICVGGAAGLALSAPGWVSFLDYLTISSIGMHSLVSLDRFDPRQAATLLLPGVFGPPYANWALASWGADGGFFGPALTMLATLALLSRSRLTAERWAMAGWIAFWLSVFFGMPVTHALWAATRPLNEVQVTRYAMPSLECAAAILAACAVDDWCRAAWGGRAVAAALIFGGLAGLTLALAGAGTAYPAWLSGGAASIFLVTAVLEAALVAAALVALSAGSPTRRRAMALVAVVAGDASVHFMLPELAGSLPNRLALGAVQFLRSHAGLERVYALDEQLPTNYGSWLGVAQIQVDVLPFAQAWRDAANTIGGGVNSEDSGWLPKTTDQQAATFLASIAGLRMAAVRYVIVNAGNDPFATRHGVPLALAYDDGHSRIYEVAQSARYFDTNQASCQITPLSRERVQTACDGPAVLVRRELSLPGWHATVNGAKAVIDPAGGFFQQVAVPAGKAEIRFTYVPPHARLMAFLFGAGALVLVREGCSFLKKRTKKLLRLWPRRWGSSEINR